MPLASVSKTALFGDSSALPDVESIVRNLAHDLRQPLSAIESIAFYLDLMMVDENSKSRKQVNRLRELVQQTNWVVSNAIHSTGSARLSLEITDIGSVAADAATKWASETGSQVTLVRPEQIRSQLLDEQQISLAFENILSFFNRGSLVHVSITTCDQQAEIELSSIELRLPEADCLALQATERIIDQHGGSLHFDPPAMVRVVLPYRF